MSDESPTDLIWRLIGEIGICMIVTRQGEQLLGRPMAGLIHKSENLIWFFADRRTAHVQDLSRHPQVCLTFADIKAQSYVSVSGHIQQMSDTALIASLWVEPALVYFPDGPADPNILLLKFVPESAEFWDSPANPIVLAIKFVQAKLTGERPDLGTQGKIDMTS